jgi:hypothetical protein
MHIYGNEHVFYKESKWVRYSDYIRNTQLVVSDIYSEYKALQKKNTEQN